jgi:cytochrome oxidase Cu insertion factor (SCO1/SenC/PrrC family)
VIINCYSITIDPTHDTSEILRTYAAGHGADPSRWRFAHAPAPELTAFASRCGLGFWHADGTVRHNLRTLVIDRAGIVRAIYEDGPWTAADLMAARDQAAIALATLAAPAAQPTSEVIAPKR